MKLRKIVLLTLLSIMILNALNVTIFADSAVRLAPLSDMPEDWSTIALENAVSNGLMVRTEGKIRPNDHLTRAEMATIITRAFNAKTLGDISNFLDVKKTDWYYENMAKSYKMGIMIGDGKNLYPHSPITRQEVFVMIARALKLNPSQSIEKHFKDSDQIADWAKENIFALIHGHYIQGNDGNIHPNNLITRAEFAQLLFNIIKEYKNKEGTYTSVSSGNVMVNVPNVTLKDLTVTGDLIVGEGGRGW
jgi:hypothetical protein